MPDEKHNKASIERAAKALRAFIHTRRPNGEPIPEPQCAAWDEQPASIREAYCDAVRAVIESLEREAS